MKAYELSDANVNFIVKRRAINMVHNHRDNGFYIDIETIKLREWLITHSHDKCVYCGCEMDIKTDACEVDSYMTIDIKYPESKLFSLDNIVLCCLRCNRAKGSMDYDEFLRFCEVVTENNSKCVEVCSK